jgi:hypothetical protein
MKICLDTRWNIDHKEWCDYFVWWPKIIIDFGTGSKYWVWLQTIRRRMVYKPGCWEYRIKWPTHGEWNI